MYRGRDERMPSLGWLPIYASDAVMFTDIFSLLENIVSTHELANETTHLIIRPEGGVSLLSPFWSINMVTACEQKTTDYVRLRVLPLSNMGLAANLVEL